MYLLIMVLDDSAHLNDVLEAWVSAGVEGVTILESTGLRRVLPRTTAQPAFMGFSQVFGSGRVGHHTLLAVINGMEVVEQAVAATERAIGDLDQPDTGIIFLLPVLKSWGLPQPYQLNPSGEE